MRKLFYLLFIPILISCNKTNNQVDNKFMDDYRYPIDSLTKAKVFVYQRTDSLDKLSFFLEQVKVEDNNKIFIYVRLNNVNSSQFRDSTVYYYRDKNLILKDKYTIAKDPKTNLEKVIKCQILQYSDSSKKREIKTKCSNPLKESIVTIISTTSTFVKKTTFKIFDRNVECLNMAEQVQINVNYKYIPFLGKTGEKTGESIIAKGIGMVYYSMNDKTSNQNLSLQLKEIINYQTYLEKYRKE